MADVELQRITTEINRASEYFTREELQAQTGQPESAFPAVILKELADNALDAAESAHQDPSLSLGVYQSDDEMIIEVADNGPGLATTTIDRILNFNTRTSNKVIYKSPTRGAQGNALKTVLGIPTAFGCEKPLIIETEGKKHEVRAWIDPLGSVNISHTVGESTVTVGASIRVSLPGALYDPELVGRWAESFAVMNPHASVSFRTFENGSNHANSNADGTAKIYQRTASTHNGWRKFTPTDLTSPWWYDSESMQKNVFSYIKESRDGGSDLTLRDFVRQFRGLSSTVKAKKICTPFVGLERLSCFDGRLDAVGNLLEAMQAEVKPPHPDCLGSIGADHFKTRFEDYGLYPDRFWYKKTPGLLKGIPFVVEAALGQTNKHGGLFHGVNFSPTFQDPTSQIHLSAGEISAFSAKGFLSNAKCIPNTSYGITTTSAVHIICPVLNFLDRGKTRLSMPPLMADAIAETLWAVSKQIYKEAKAKERDALRHERAAKTIYIPAKEPSLKEAVFEVMAQAYQNASDNETVPVSVRDLFYDVRPLVQPLTSKALDYNYFSQNLLPEYQRQFGAIDRLYYDPRGLLYVPHTGEEIPLGGKNVEDYEFPNWVYDKILFIEKKGMLPLLKSAEIAERYDIALCMSEGYATEAARVLFKNAGTDKQYRLFVLHDADPDGYNIARTLQTETKRMPGHHIEVIDLGFFLEEALDMGLEAEEFTRKKTLISNLTLTQKEKEYFEGRRVTQKQWIARRIELNAMRPRQRLNYIEAKLKEHGADRKVMPPDRVIRDTIVDHYAKRLYDLIMDELEDRLDMQKLVSLAKKQIPEQAFQTDPVRSIDCRTPQSWREIARKLGESQASKAMKTIDWEKVMENGLLRNPRNGDL